MKITTLLTCGILLSTVSAHAHKAAVVPGFSAGEIRLGDTLETTTKILGKPSKTSKQDDILQHTWLGPVPPNDQYGHPSRDRSFYTVLFKNNKAIQIEYNSPDFVTTGNISTRNSLAQFREKYPPSRTRAYGYEDYVGYYYDDTKHGITFVIGIQDNFDAKAKPDSLIVHLPGKIVTPKPGGDPAKPIDEVPVAPD